MEHAPLLPPEERPAAPAPATSRLHSLRLIFFQPHQAFVDIVHQPRKAAWLVPLVLIIALAVIAALLASQATPRTSAVTGSGLSTRTTQSSTQQSRTNSNRQSQGGTAQQGGGFFAPGDMPPGGAVVIEGGPAGGAFFPGAQTNGTTTSQTGQSTTASQTTNPFVATGLPALSFIITWLLLGVLTSIFSLAFGGHSGAGMALTIAAWASIPLGVRNLMQIIYYLATGSAIQAPGLSGFAPSPNGNAGLIFLQQLLSRIDIYLFWQIALLAVGVGVWGGLARKKSIPAAILVVVVVLLLQALIAMGLELLGNVNLNTSLLLRMR